MPDATQTAPPATPGMRDDPLRAYDWKIQILGLTAGHFMKCSDLEINVEVISFPEGGDHGVERKMPGRIHFSSITLEQGLTSSKELWDWMQSAVTKPPVQRKSVAILMMATDGVTEKLRWNLHDAWPCQWRAHPLDAANSQVAIHSLRLAYESLDQDAT
jgi:phage tail-like protein